MENKMKTLKVLLVIFFILALIFFFIAFERKIYDRAYEEGFDACIEENNLYERYEINGK